MAFELELGAVTPQAFTADGTATGRVTLAKPHIFKVGQRVDIVSDTVGSTTYQVRRVYGTFLTVGPVNGLLKTTSDVSAYAVADNARIGAQEQKRPMVPGGEVDRVSYTEDQREHEEEPTNARRSVLVDPAGNLFDAVVDNDGIRRLAVDTPPVQVAVGDITVSAASPARNTYGSTTNVASSGSATVVSYVADSNFRFRGFVANGTTDAKFIVKYDGVTKYVKYTSITSPNAELILPNPDGAASSKTVALLVVNRGDVTGDFEATILGE